MNTLVEVHPGLWVGELYAVWFVDGKTWLLLQAGKNHWVPGDHVDEIVRKWQEGPPRRPPVPREQWPGSGS